MVSVFNITASCFLMLPDLHITLWFVHHLYEWSFVPGTSDRIPSISTRTSFILHRGCLNRKMTLIPVSGCLSVTNFGRPNPWLNTVLNIASLQSSRTLYETHARSRFLNHINLQLQEYVFLITWSLLHFTSEKIYLAVACLCQGFCLHKRFIDQGSYCRSYKGNTIK